jgi:hypothetical protein
VSQEYESIGSPAPPLEAVAGERNGWPEDVPQPLGAQATAHDISFFAERANTQALGRVVSSMAAHVETPMAAREVTPW